MTNQAGYLQNGDTPPHNITPPPSAPWLSIAAFIVGVTLTFIFKIFEYRYNGLRIGDNGVLAMVGLVALSYVGLTFIREAVLQSAQDAQRVRKPPVDQQQPPYTRLGIPDDESEELASIRSIVWMAAREADAKGLDRRKHAAGTLLRLNMAFGPVDADSLAGALLPRSRS